MFPRWGTLLTYGSALVMSTFRLPGSGRMGFADFHDSAMSPIRRLGTGRSERSWKKHAPVEDASVGQGLRSVEAGLLW